MILNKLNKIKNFFKNKNRNKNIFLKFGISTISASSREIIFIFAVINTIISVGSSIAGISKDNISNPARNGVIQIEKVQKIEAVDLSVSIEEITQEQEAVVQEQKSKKIQRRKHRKRNTRIRTLSDLPPLPPETENKQIFYFNENGRRYKITYY